jgi:hypothetical protein
VRVLVGGLGFCCGPQIFVKQLYKSKAMRKRGRHLAAHTYSPSPEVAIQRLRQVRKKLPRKVDIAITEHGWSTCPEPTRTPQRKCVKPQRQADQMEEYIDRLRAQRRRLKVRAFYWFQAMDFSTFEEVEADCPDSPKHFYGIWRKDGTAKPSLAVWSEATGVALPTTVPPNPAPPRACRE